MQFQKNGRLTRCLSDGASITPFAAEALPDSSKKLTCEDWGVRHESLAKPLAEDRPKTGMCRHDDKHHACVETRRKRGPICGGFRAKTSTTSTSRTVGNGRIASKNGAV